MADLGRFEKDSVVDPEALIQHGLVKKVYDGIKILGEGEIDRPIFLKVHKWTRSVSDKIIAAGGKVEGL